MSTLLPVFDTSLANCSTCELDAQCKAGKLCYAYQPPKNFNGLMLIGEGPGQHEVLQGRPFVGQAGKLLRALIESAGLNMDECWITNATLGRPPVMKDKKGFHEQYPNAISSCLSRLEAEIAACKPRVIVTLGAAALIAMTGRDKVGVRREAFDCKACGNTRKAGPVLQCSAPVQQGDGTAKPCHELHFIEGPTMEAQAASVEALKLHGCKACGARFKNVRAKMVKCPACGGRKMRDTEIHSFVHDYGLTQVAGAIFEPAPGAEERKAHEIDHWFHEQSVRYLVPTYHPAFLLRDQQFMAKAVQKHLGKAKRLLTEDAPWPVKYEVTRDAEVLREYCLTWSPRNSDLSLPVFTVDVETECIRETPEGPVRGDARDPYQITEIKVVGIRRQGAPYGLVVDTRGVQIMSGDDDLLDALQEFLEAPLLPKCYQNGLYDLACFVHLWGFTWERLNESYADDTLGAHAALYPDEPHDLGHITFSFTDSRAWKPERRVRGQAVHENFDELALYNARDIWNTDAVRESMGAANGKAVPGGKLHRAGLSKVYEIDSDLRRVAFEMQMVGMPVNRNAREEAAKKARTLRDSALVRCREAVTVAKFQGEFNPFSQKDLQKVLFDTKEGFGLPALKLTKGGKASSDEGTVYKLLGIAKDEPVIQFLRALLDVREHHKVLSTYVESDKLAPREDGRVHPNWKPWGARTGRFSSSPNCFDPLTEVLTLDGWKKLPKLKSTELVAQWRDGKIEFVRPTRLTRRHWRGALVHIKNEHIDLKVTPDHRCLLQHRKTGELRVFTAADYPEDWHQLHAGDGPDGPLNLSPAEITLLCATQADGHYTASGYQIDFCFTKRRKIRRLLAALRSVQQEHLHTEPQFHQRRDARRRTRITLLRGPLVTWLKNQLPAKHFTWAFLQMSKRSRALFCDEIFRWDGCATRMNHYSSSDRDNVNVVQAILTLNNARSYRHIYTHPGVTKPNFQVNITHRNYSGTTNRMRRRVPYTGYVYCLSVPSSFILIRRGHTPMITGQCQNIPIWLRHIFEAGPGRVLVGADGDQIELRVIGALSGDPELIRRCMTADEKKKLEPDHDPHSFVAGIAFGSQYTRLLLIDPTHDKKLAEVGECKCQTCRRKALRDLEKRVIYGGNYGGGPKKIHEVILQSLGVDYRGPPITVEMVAHIQRTIDKVFPGVSRYRERVYAEAREKREIRSPFHNRRRIFPLGDVSFTEAVNFPIQSAAADMVNDATVNIYYELASVDPTARFVAQVHDAIYVEAAEDKGEAVGKLLEKHMTCEHVLQPGAPAMQFTASAKVGRKWG
jgi:uracil-DNA glycosylase family 4